jgi:hypothetical protein
VLKLDRFVASLTDDAVAWSCSSHDAPGRYQNRRPRRVL